MSLSSFMRLCARTRSPTLFANNVSDYRRRRRFTSADNRGERKWLIQLQVGNEFILQSTMITRRWIMQLSPIPNCSDIHCDLVPVRCGGQWTRISKSLEFHLVYPLNRFHLTAGHCDCYRWSIPPEHTQPTRCTHNIYVTKSPAFKHRTKHLFTSTPTGSAVRIRR